ncbi:MAG: traC 1, partial [Mucilaginibacter sp.]|nr:traC 1 [Mucilaginibacter sp.]
LNRPMEGKFGSMEYAKEELRAALASMVIGSQLKIGHQFGQHAAYSGNWMKMLKDEPYEIARAASDAQKTADLLLGIGQKREVKQTTSPVTTLTKGDEIAYNNTTYKVLDQKGKTLEMEKADTGEKFKLKPSDKLFKNLVDALNNPPALELAEQEEITHKIGR